MKDALAAALEAGLQLACRDFPEDVAAAAQIAAQCRAALAELSDTAAEPWPPMQARRAP